MPFDARRTSLLHGVFNGASNKTTHLSRFSASSFQQFPQEVIRQLRPFSSMATSHGFSILASVDPHSLLSMSVSTSRPSSRPMDRDAVSGPRKRLSFFYDIALHVPTLPVDSPFQNKRLRNDQRTREARCLPHTSDHLRMAIEVLYPRRRHSSRIAEFV
jgi:hypothetical protein